MQLITPINTMVSSMLFGASRCCGRQGDAVHRGLPAPPMRQGAAACGRGGPARSRRTGPAPGSARTWPGPLVLRRAGRSYCQQITCKWSHLQPRVGAAQARPLSLPTLHAVAICCAMIQHSVGASNLTTGSVYNRKRSDRLPQESGPARSWWVSKTRKVEMHACAILPFAQQLLRS